MKLFCLLGSIAVNEWKPLPERLSTAPPAECRSVGAT
jgi:hypothetical protein